MDATRRWLRRNRTNFAIGAGVVGVGYIAGQYVISKIGEARDRMVSDRVAKENLRRRFQQNQEDCTITVLELLPAITENILAAQPSEKITQELQMKKAQRLGRTAATSDLAQSETSVGTKSALEDDRGSLSSESYVHAHAAASSSTGSEELRPDRSKAQLWHDLKLSSLTRAFTLIYVVALLGLLTRIQLNLLGRRSYLASLIAHASDHSQDPTINLEDRANANPDASLGDQFETNRQYLTFSWWLLHKGWKDIMAKVSSAVQEVFGPVKPTADVQPDQFSSLVLELRKRVEGATTTDRGTTSWLPVLLPPRAEEDQVLRDSGMLSNPLVRSNEQQNGPVTTASPSAHSLRALLDETADVAESPLFHSLLTLLLDACFSQLVDNRVRAELYKAVPSSSATGIQSGFESMETSAPAPVKFASILAVITKEAHQIGSGSPNDYVQVVDNVEDLDAFAAVIYSNNIDIDPEHFRSNDQEIFEEGQHHDDSGAHQDSQPTMAEKAASLADTAWSGFESMWGRIIG